MCQPGSVDVNSSGYRVGKRQPGNLGAVGSCRYFPEIATASSKPRNDRGGSLYRSSYVVIARSAATWQSSGSWFLLLLPRDCHGPSALAMTGVEVCTVALTLSLRGGSEATDVAIFWQLVLVATSLRLPRAFGPRNDRGGSLYRSSYVVIARSAATWAARERCLWQRQATAAAGQALAFAQAKRRANA